jgi:endonuclease III
MTKAQLLVDYIKSLPNFVLLNQCDGQYNHMGATITDAALQAGINYDNVVKPRVQSILEIFPAADTTSKFSELINREGAEHLLKWQGAKKLRIIHDLLKLFINEKIESEDELKSWLANSANHQRLSNIRGIGPKTIDYMQILVGIDTMAVDVHVNKLLSAANIDVKSYAEKRKLLCEAADLLKIEKTNLDHSIWRYMSNRSREERRKKTRNVSDS